MPENWKMISWESWGLVTARCIVAAVVRSSRQLDGDGVGKSELTAERCNSDVVDALSAMIDTYKEGSGAASALGKLHEQRLIRYHVLEAASFNIQHYYQGSCTLFYSSLLILYFIKLSPFSSLKPSIILA